MSQYLLQADVVRRLSMERRKMLRDRVELPATSMILDDWQGVVDDLSAFASGVWSQENAQNDPHGAARGRHRIMNRNEETVRAFRGRAVGILNTAKRQGFEHQFLIAHWILDQVTPPNIVIRPNMATVTSYTPVGRRRTKPRESWFEQGAEGEHATDASGDAVPSHEHKVDAWLKAWGAAAGAGAMLGSVSADTPADAAARIESARAGGYGMADVLSRLVSTEVQVSIADGDGAFMDAYGRFVERREWVTMDDERVCADCSDNEGLTPDEVDEDIPRHPRCRCWWRITAQPYQELAGEMGAPGSGRSVMAFRDPATGEVAGVTILDFDVWRQRML